MWANRAFILAIVSLFLVELGMLLGAIAVAIGARSYKILKRVGAPADKAKKAIIIGGAAVAVGAVVLVLLIVFVF
jgi:NADPH-dependent curcumin reductase CurA